MFYTRNRSIFSVLVPAPFEVYVTGLMFMCVHFEFSICDSSVLVCTAD